MRLSFGLLLGAALITGPRLAAAQSGVDLSLGNVSLSPTRASIGSTVTVSGLILAAPSFTGNVRVEVSAPFLIGPSPGSSIFVNGTSAAFSVSFVVPSGTAAGNYPVQAIVDPDSLVLESNETNNAITATPLLDVPTADLRAVSLSGAPVATAGLPYSIAATVENIGLADANGFVYQYYLGRRPTGPPLLQVGPVSIPAASASAYIDTIVLPAQPGPATISLWVNPTAAVPEANLNNNVRTFDLTIRVPEADLVGSIVSFTPTAEVGQTVTMSGNIQNLGDAESSTVTYAYVLSLDAVIDASDREIHRATVPPVERGSTVGVQDTFRIPADVAPSIYFLGVYADPDDVETETDETNNGAPGRMLTIFEPELLITTNSLPEATVGQSYVARLEFIGGAFAPTWSVTQGRLPNGLSLDTSGGTITGRPTESGTFRFTVQAASGGATSEVDLVLDVLPGGPPQIVTAALPIAIAGRPYDFALTAVDGAPPLTWSAAGLPAWASLSPTGALSGTPPAAGEARFTVTVSDARGRTDEATLTLTITDVTDAVRILQISPPEGVVGRAYCDPTAPFAFEAELGTPPYTWSASGDVPPGLVLAPSGELCGVPSEVGTFDFVVRVQDAAGLVDTAGFRIVVGAGDSVMITSTALPGGLVGRPYETTLEADGAAPLAFSLAQEGLPPGLELASDGRIFGTPTTTGNFAFVAQVTDARGGADTAVLSIRVARPTGGELEDGEDGGCICARPGPVGAPWGWLALLLTFGVRVRPYRRR